MIRPASAADVPTILTLIRELATYERSPDAVQADEAAVHAALFGPDPRAFALLATEDSAAGELPVGFAVWFVSYSTWTGRHGVYLEDLFVRPEHRGHGHGRALLAELAAIAAERGYRRLEWAVLDWNTPAVDFYRSLGAEPMSEWTVWRASGPALARLARSARRPARYGERDGADVDTQGRGTGKGAGVSQSPSSSAGTDTVTINLPAQSAYLSVLRTATAALAARLDFTLDDIEDLRIAVDEACALLLAASAPDSDLTCSFSPDGDALEVRVSTVTRDGERPARDTFAWTVLAALAGEVDSIVEDKRVTLRLRKSRHDYSADFSAPDPA